MIRICYVCLRVYGEKPPFEDKRETSGICPECLPGELKKLQEFIDTKNLKTPNKDITS